jgi:DDE family transposase
MQTHDSTDRLLAPLRRHLSKPQWQNLLALVVALQLARTLVQRQLALYLLWAIASESCYRRLTRLLSWQPPHWEGLQRAWLRAVLRQFAPGSGRLTLLIDWTLHRDRCRSLWVMLPLGGRAVPLAFWLAPIELGGKGAQRSFEDQALIQLRAWLPAGRRVLLIGDRGFRGRDRMQFLKRLRFQFILRVTGDTMVEIDGAWVRLQDVAPAVGQRRQWAAVRYGKEKPKERLTVNLVAVRQALPTPKPVLTNKGKKTGKTVEETIWFLATDLPLSTDAVALYAQRMQIEQSFRDSKALLGLEREQTKQPWVRLRTLLWALQIGYTLDLQLGGAAPAVAPRPPRVGALGDPVRPLGKPAYRAQSATREGLHALVLAVLLGEGPLAVVFRDMAAKSARLQARPQVANRRRKTPAPRRRTRRGTRHVHA